MSTAADLTIVRGWWAGLASEVPVRATGLRFGLLDDRRTVHVEGCRHRETPYDEWTQDVTWWPNGRFVHVPGLAGVPADGWDAAEAYVVELVRTLRPEVLAPSHVRAIAMGAGEGDFVQVWPLVRHPAMAVG